MLRWLPAAWEDLRQKKALPLILAVCKNLGRNVDQGSDAGDGVRRHLLSTQEAGSHIIDGTVRMDQRMWSLTLGLEGDPELLWLTFGSAIY